MGNQDERAAVLKLTRILRRVTRVIQWIPFAYLIVYALGAFLETQMSEEMLCFRDTVLTISPLVNVGFLGFSRLLELCRWHRIACIIPLGTPVAGYVDCYVIQFTQNEVICINILFGIISSVFLVLANHHFFGHGRERIATANT